MKYFGIQLGYQDKVWAPHIACKTCTDHLRQQTKGYRKQLKFHVPMIWREPRDHYDNCYFCKVSLIGINRNNRSNLIYPNLESALRPICNPYLMPSSQVAVEFLEIETILSDDKDIEPYNETSPCKKSLNQKELNQGSKSV